MRRKKILVALMSSLYAVNTIAASNTIINEANNQGYINALYGDNRLSYGSNRPADSGAPLYNAHSVSPGVEIGITKTFGNIYSQFSLSAEQSNLNYSDTALTGLALSSGHAVALSMNGKLGYSFNPNTQFTMTPYFAGGYFNNQLDTGGYSASFVSTNYNGATLITQSFYYGIGLLNQWAANNKWVLSIDGQLGTQYHPWVNGNVNNFNNQPTATTTYQQWNLARALNWQIGLGSDYLIGNHLHFRAGVTCGDNPIGGQNSLYTGVFPSQNQQYWLWKLGLGYDLSGVNSEISLPIGGGQEAIHAANNEASIRIAYQAPNFNGGTTLNQYHQSGGVPALGIIFNKTWQRIYTQVAIAEAIGETTYQGQTNSINIDTTTNNSYFDALAKLGYQFQSGQNTMLTPYATLGYHRWAQDFQGIPTTISSINGLGGIYYINGLTETYQHSWYGLGLLGQWAVLPKLVLSIDGNLGYTFNSSLHSWTVMSLPLTASYTLGNAMYQMIGLGADYAIGKNWHAQMNLNYWHYRYKPSAVNTLGASSLSDQANQWNAGIGIGYSF